MMPFPPRILFSAPRSSPGGRHLTGAPAVDHSACRNIGFRKTELSTPGGKDSPAPSKRLSVEYGTWRHGIQCTVGMAVILLLASCNRQETVTYVEEEPAPLPEHSVPAVAQSPGDSRKTSEPADEISTPDLRWTLPENWTVEPCPGSNVRLATFRISGEPGIQCALYRLAGTAKAFEACLRMWARQSGVEALSETEIPGFLERQTQFVGQGGRKWRLIDFTSLSAATTGARVSVVIAVSQDAHGLLALKMAGDRDILSRERTALRDVAASLSDGSMLPGGTTKSEDDTK